MVGACVGQRCVVCRAEKTNRREKLVWATVTPFGGIRTEELTVYPGTHMKADRRRFSWAVTITTGIP